MDLIQSRNVFKSLTGVNTFDSAEHEPIMQMAMDKIYHMLKPGVTFTSTNTALVYAIAAEAYYQYTLIKSGTEDDGNIKVGNVSINSDLDKVIARAKKIRDEIFCMAKDYLILQDDGFYFNEIKNGG